MQYYGDLGAFKGMVNTTDKNQPIIQNWSSLLTSHTLTRLGNSLTVVQKATGPETYHDFKKHVEMANTVC